MTQSTESESATRPWVDGLLISQVLQQTADRRGDADCLVFHSTGYRKSYREFLDEVERTARGLVALGIRRRS